MKGHEAVKLEVGLDEGNQEGDGGPWYARAKGKEGREVEL